MLNVASVVLEWIVTASVLGTKTRPSEAWELGKVLSCGFITSNHCELSEAKGNSESIVQNEE